jgi:hypothetical protein
VNDRGRRLMAGTDDWLRTGNGIDRWIGGVHLEGPDAQWRWDNVSRTLVQSSAGP